MARRRGSGIGLKAALVLLPVSAAALGTFAIPVPSWHTGEVEIASPGVAIAAGGPETKAANSMAMALRKGPLMILALGPVTDIAVHCAAMRRPRSVRRVP